MIPARRRKLLILLFSLIILSTATALILYALRQNISLFYTPTQALNGEVPQHHPIRMGGIVEQGSVIRAPKGLGVQFKITDIHRSVTVDYKGILPDLFREGQAVVVAGQLLDNQHLHAREVLAKHDANYMPPEVQATLANKEDL